MWEPRLPPQGQKAVFSMECCSKSRVDLFVSGRARERFWSLKWAQMDVQIGEKVTKNALRKSIRISNQKLTQNGFKTKQKWIQNEPKTAPEIEPKTVAYFEGSQGSPQGVRPPSDLHRLPYFGGGVGAQLKLLAS